MAQDVLLRKVIRSEKSELVAQDVPLLNIFPLICTSGTTTCTTYTVFPVCGTTGTTSAKDIILPIVPRTEKTKIVAQVVSATCATCATYWKIIKSGKSELVGQVMLYS